MARNLVWSTRANDELFEAMEFLDEHQDGLGNDLFEEIVAAVTPALSLPQAFRETSPGVCRVLTARFSFAAFYTFDDDFVTILAVVHTARDPESWP